MADLEPQPLPTTRASDADRDRVLSILATATSDGRLSVEEHGELMERTLHARTVGELQTITTDLEPHGAPVAEAPAHVVASSQPKKRGLVAVFGARTRKGAWQVPTELRATAVFGAVELDFRNATFDAEDVVLIANCTFGAIEITVPAWVRVIDEGTAIFGAREEAGTPGGPTSVTLHVRGLSLFGAVEIKHKAPKIDRGGGVALPGSPG